MGRDDVRVNLRSWEADSADYQDRNRFHLNRWELLGWGVWDVPEDEIHALGDVAGLDALELGTGAAQFGIKVAMRGAQVTGLDFSANQLRQALGNMDETGVRFPLVRADAEDLPFAESSFDLVFCDHGATTFTDPAITIPQVARVLRPGGLFVFDIATPIIWLTWGENGEPPGRELLRPYFALGRDHLQEDDGESIEWMLTYGGWIRLFRDSGFMIEDLIELRPDPDAKSTYDFAQLPWARDFPGEHIWKVRKAGS
jgi:SAM-dependent methyltransferase